MKDRDFYKNLLPVKSIKLNNLTKMNDKRTGTITSCSFCGILFNRPASHLSRCSEPCCSRACSDENRKKRYTKNCVCCGVEMLLTASNFQRISTCSKKCKSNKMKKEGSQKSGYYGYEYREERKLKLKTFCESCGVENNLTYSNKKTLCQSCHCKKISPNALEQRRIKKGY